MYQCDESYEDEYDIVKPEPENEMGCFKDTPSKRVLNLKTGYKLADMTPEVRCRPWAVGGSCGRACGCWC